VRLLPLALLLLLPVAPAAQPSVAEVETFLIGAAFALHAEWEGRVERGRGIVEFLPDGRGALLDTAHSELLLFESAWRVSEEGGALILYLPEIAALRLDPPEGGRISGYLTDGSGVVHLVEVARPDPSEAEALRAALAGKWVEEETTTTLAADGSFAQRAPGGSTSGRWDLLPALRHLLLYPAKGSRGTMAVHALEIEAVDEGALRLRLHGGYRAVALLRRAGR
jgi:hypothetical protein